MNTHALCAFALTLLLASTASATPPACAPTPKPGRPLGHILLTVVGGLAIATGGVLVVLSTAVVDPEIQALRKKALETGDGKWTRLMGEKQDEALVQNSAGWGFLAVGGALAGGGILLMWLYKPPAPPKKKAQASPSFHLLTKSL